MKREELYDAVMAISNEYNLPVKINKKTKKQELQKMYDNMKTLKNENQLIENDDVEDLIKDELYDILNDDTKYETEDDDEDDSNYTTEIEPLNDNAIEEYEPEPEPEPVENKKLKSKRMKQILKKGSINSLKREVNVMIKQYNIDCDKLLDVLENTEDITDEEIDIVINAYNEVRENTENEINLTIDTFEGNIPETFYTWIEGVLDKKKRQLEKMIA